MCRAQARTEDCCKDTVLHHLNDQPATMYDKDNTGVERKGEPCNVLQWVPRLDAALRSTIVVAGHRAEAVE